MPKRGYYIVVGRISGIDDEQADFLDAMRGHILFQSTLRELMEDGGMNGAIIRHIKTDVVYLIQDSEAKPITSLRSLPPTGSVD